jgi:hypothetical protein
MTRRGSISLNRLEGRYSRKFGHQNPLKVKKLGHWEDVLGSLILHTQDQEETVALGGSVDT